MKHFQRFPAVMLLCVISLACSGCSGDESSSGASSEPGVLEGDGDGHGGATTASNGTDLTPSNGVAAANNSAASNDAATEPTCTYPENSGLIAMGKVMPRLWWEKVYMPDGTIADFDLADFHCSPDYDRYSVAIVVVSAGWCPACPDYIRYVGEQAEQLEAAGGLLIFVETELSDGSPATHPDADAHITELIDTGKGIRIGDGETFPEPMTIYNAPLITGFPGGFVVRRSDMQIIADQGSTQYYLPFEEIAMNPGVVDELDPAREPSCSVTEEEVYEPNNTVLDAALLDFGDYTGGICDGTPDFYRIETLRPDDRWLFEIRFFQKDGDLDFYLWDPETDRAVVDRQGNPIGSDSSDDNEVFQWEGSATIKIFGYNGSTAAYEISLVDL